ncbi:MAG: phage virion morphogenesis protein [Azoarcus sp.]|jgi:hypothetical protein|nr:phage virion morphogenesis protein [Azoarcus sp.]
MQYTISIDVNRFAGMLDALAREFEDTALWLENFGQALENANRQRHRAGRDPQGEPWKTLKHPNQPPGRRGGPLNRTG